MNAKEKKKSGSRLVAAARGKWEAWWKNRNKETAKVRTVFLLRGILSLGVTFLFAHASPAFGAYPFGTAFFCSLTKEIPFALFGLLGGALFAGGNALLLFLLAIALFFGRILYYRKKGGNGENFPLFGEPLLFRLALATGAAVISSLSRYSSGGFLHYDLFGLFFEVGFVPVLTFVFSSAFTENKYLKKETAILLGLVALTYASGSLSLFGFSLPVLFAALIGFFTSLREGELKGGVAGLVCGLAANRLYSPVLSLGALLCGKMRKFGAVVSVTLASLAMVVCGVYVGGADSLRDFAPDILSSAILFLPLSQLVPLHRKKEKHEKEIFPPPELFFGDAGQKLTEMSESFSALSALFYRLSEKSGRPGVAEMNEICENEFDRTCSACSMKHICWEKERERTWETVRAIASSIGEKGYLEEDALPEWFRSRCLCLPRLIGNINEANADLLEAGLKSNRTEVFAADYRSMAKLLRDTIVKRGEEETVDRQLGRQLSEKLEAMRLPVANVCVYGTRRKRILAGNVDLLKMNCPASAIRNAFEEVCGFRLTEPSFSIGEDFHSMTLVSARQFGVDFVSSGGKMTGEVLNGDLICLFENREDYCYVLLSDGMGSGREAAMTSRICGVFLEKMLSAGNSKAVSLEMLNDFLRCRGSECSATVDLLEIDLLSGKAVFVKSGSSSSYILREDRLFRIASRSMPIGITEKNNAEEITFTLRDGDRVVMMTDGVGGQYGEGVWLGEMLANEWEEDGKKMCEKILLRAEKENVRPDDMTVGILTLKALPA